MGFVLFTGFPLGSATQARWSHRRATGLLASLRAADAAIEPFNAVATSSLRASASPLGSMRHPQRDNRASANGLHSPHKHTVSYIESHKYFEMRLWIIGSVSML